MMKTNYPWSSFKMINNEYTFSQAKNCEAGQYFELDPSGIPGMGFGTLVPHPDYPMCYVSYLAHIFIGPGRQYHKCYWTPEQDEQFAFLEKHSDEVPFIGLERRHESFSYDWSKRELCYVVGPYSEWVGRKKWNDVSISCCPILPFRIESDSEGSVSCVLYKDMFAWDKKIVHLEDGDQIDLENAFIDGASTRYLTVLTAPCQINGVDLRDGTNTNLVSEALRVRATGGAVDLLLHQKMDPQYNLKRLGIADRVG